MSATTTYGVVCDCIFYWRVSQPKIHHGSLMFMTLASSIMRQLRRFTRPWLSLQIATSRLYCVEWTQYSIRPKRSAVRAQAGYFLHSTMPSVRCMRLIGVIVICRVTYVQFPIQSAFLPYIGRQAAPALRHIGFNTQYRTSDVAENLGSYLTYTHLSWEILNWF